MLITVLTPSGNQVNLAIADNTLVFDGLEFKEPQDLKYVELYGVPVEASTVPYKELPQQTLMTAVRIKAIVLGTDPTEASLTDPQVVSVSDPSMGQCICGLTCAGTDLRFVTVTYVPS